MKQSEVSRMCSQASTLRCQSRCKAGAKPVRGQLGGREEGAGEPTHTRLRECRPTLTSTPKTRARCCEGLSLDITWIPACWRPPRPLFSRILGHERPGWCYSTGRWVYLPSVTCYGQSIKPPSSSSSFPPTRPQYKSKLYYRMSRGYSSLGVA